MRIQKIKLTDILIEEPFRKKTLNLELVYDIKSSRLKSPLKVEKTDESKFVLVEGYRRYFALQYINEIHADCIVEKRTSELTRVIKRLSAEFHQKKRSSYELQRMVEYLYANGLNDHEIAEQCSVTPATVDKYLEGLEVNREWLIGGEKTGAGKHGFTVIHKMKYLKGNNKEYIKDIYTDRQINGEDLKKLNKAIKTGPFQQSSTESQKEIIKTISHLKSSDEEVKEIVYGQSLKEKYSLSAHQFVYRIIIKLLTRVHKYFDTNFTNNLSTPQKNQLYNHHITPLVDKLGNAKKMVRIST